MNDREMNGKVISEIFYEELREFVNKTDKHPKIVDISIGDDFASKKYVNIKKSAERIYTYIINNIEEKSIKQKIEKMEEIINETGKI